MIKKIIVGLVIYCMVCSVLCQNFRFQRVIECQNNEFQLVEQNVSTDLQMLNDSRQKRIEQGLAGVSQKTRLQKQQDHPKKTVRCKKWVQSYKLIQKNNLRKTDQQSLPQVVYQHIKKPLKSIEKRGLISSQSLQNPQILKIQSDVSQKVGVSLTSSQQQQAERLISLYFHYTMMNNILVYIG